MDKESIGNLGETLYAVFVPKPVALTSQLLCVKCTVKRYKYVSCFLRLRCPSFLSLAKAILRTLNMEARQKRTSENVFTFTTRDRL